MRALVLVACGAFGLAACGARIPAPPAAPPPGVERQFLVREAELEQGGISVRLEIPLAPAGPKPALLANLSEGSTMLGEGVVIVTYKIDWARLKEGPPPEPPAEANTVGKWILASPSADVLGRRYLQQIAATATVVIPKVVDYLETVPDVDATRLTITGGSTNGFIALQAVAADRRIGVATAVAACGDYHRFLRDSSLGMEGRPLALARGYDAWIRRQEVLTHPGALVHATVLMVNRVGDPIIPISCANETDRVLRRAYALRGRPGRFRYVRIGGVEGHGLGPRESEENLTWLRTWLLGAR